MVVKITHRWCGAIVVAHSFAQTLQNKTFADVGNIKQDFPVNKRNNQMSRTTVIRRSLKMFFMRKESSAVSEPHFRLLM